MPSVIPVPENAFPEHPLAQYHPDPSGAAAHGPDKVPAHRCMGLVIRGADVFNTSRVFTMFTRDLGRVEGIAKGSRRLKSPFENGLDLLSICDIVILRKGNETLDLITIPGCNIRGPRR